MALLFSLLKIVISMAIQAYLSRQDDIEGPGASKIKPDSINTASAEKSIPAFFGKVEFSGANVLWYGDSSAESVYKEVSAGPVADFINGKQKVFIGYKYSIGMQCSIGIALDNTPIKIHSMFVDQDKIMFEDQAGITSGQNSISKPVLFGGSSELNNGWVGNFNYYDGTQLSKNTYLQEKIGVDEVPILKDLAHIVFESNSIGTSPNPRPISFEVSHYPVPSWGNITEAKIGDDYNPIYALWYALTNKIIGVGIDPNFIDVTKFQEAAAVIKQEGIGISMELGSQVVFSDFQKTIEDIISGLLSVDYNTGLYSIKLNRDDYDINTIPSLNESEISKLVWNKPTTNSLMSEIKVAFKNRENNYTGDLAIFSDLGVRYNKQMSKSTTLNFDWIKDPNTASKIAARELKSLSYPLITGNLVVSSKYMDLKRGDVVNIEYAPDDLYVPVRILSIDYGLLEENKIKIDFAEDFFGRFDASFTPPQPTKFNPEAQEALPANSYYVEAPFYLNKEQFGANFIIIAEQPDSSNFEYDMYTDVNGDYQLNGSSDFSPTADLNTSIDMGSSSIIIKNGKLISKIKDHTASENRSGQNLIVIQDGTNEEWMAFETITDNLDGTFTLNSVKRGIFHTKLKSFSVDSKVLFITYGNTYIASLINGSVNYKLLTKTLQDELTLNEAPAVLASEEGVNKINYPVIDLKLNGQYIYDVNSLPISGFDVTWSFQKRDEVNFFTDSKTYNGTDKCIVLFYELDNSGNQLSLQGQEINGTSLAYSNSDPSAVKLRVRIVNLTDTDGYLQSEEYDKTFNLV